MSVHVGTVELEQLAGEFASVEHLAASDADHAKAWAAVFRAKPEVMHAILADYVKHRYAVPGVVGQRPMPREADVDVEDLLRGPGTNMRPLVEVLPGLLPTGKTKFARKVYMTPAKFNEVLDGRYQPSLSELRTIATAIGINPAYFVEYRQLLVIDALDHLFTTNPNLATSLWRKFIHAHPEATR
jgi:hypothetical protein